MYQRILVPVDGSASSNRGLQEAIALARLTKARLRMIHVVDALAYGYLMDAYSGYVGDWMATLQDAGEKLLESAQAAARSAGVEADTVMREGLQRRLHEFVEEEVADWQADLVVIGTHGRKGMSRLFLGSDAERIVRTATVPVLLVRLPESTDTGAEQVRATHVHLPAAALSIE